MLTDTRLHTAIKNTAIHMVVMFGITLPLSFSFGFFLAQRWRGYRFFRVIFFSPVMLSVSALSMMFLGLYLPDGIINYVLRSIGLDSWTRVWLSNPDTALGAVIFADMWAAIGFYSVLFFASISGIPKELFEAAEIDGASYWGKMWRIAFPVNRDFVGVVMMLIYIWTLANSAQIVLLLTRGRPGTSSLTLSYYLYEQAFVTDRLGYIGQMVDGRFGRSVGEGFIMGEGAGATELVLQAKYAVAAAWTQAGPPTILTERFMAYLGATNPTDMIEGLVTKRYKLWAEAAPIVFDAAREGDAVSLSLVLWAAEALASMTVGVARQMQAIDEEITIVTGGSFFKAGPILIDPLRIHIFTEIRKARVVHFNDQPVIGAVLLAMRNGNEQPYNITIAHKQLLKYATGSTNR